MIHYTFSLKFNKYYNASPLQVMKDTSRLFSFRDQRKKNVNQLNNNYVISFKEVGNYKKILMTDKTSQKYSIKTICRTKYRCKKVKIRTGRHNKRKMFSTDEGQIKKNM